MICRLVPLLVIVIFGYVKSAELKCDRDKFTACQDTFATSLGIDPAINWEKPDELMAAVQGVYTSDQATDTNGLIKVCKAFNDMIRCLNKDSLDVDTCISAKWLLYILQSDNKVDVAYPYAMLMKQIRWQCSAGFYPAYDNWDCIKKAYENKKDKLMACITSFRTNANHAPEREICDYAAKGKRCYQQLFYETCPDSAAVSNYGCESFRQYVLAEFPQCDNFCEGIL